MLSRVVIVLHGLILVLASSPCGAGHPGDVSAEEYAMLPAYCPDKLNFGAEGMEGPKAPYWIEVMGGRQNWAPIHHYCWALITLLRAGKMGIPDVKRKYAMSDAVGDIDFVIKNARPDFKLLPEIFTKKAELLAKLKKNSDAAMEYRKAVQVKQDYWPAYQGLAELYRSNKQIDEARAVVEEGLKHTPQSKTLNTMLAELQKSGAKAVPRKQESAQNRVPSKTPAPPGQAPTQQDSTQQQDPSPAK